MSKEKILEEFLEQNKEISKEKMEEILQILSEKNPEIKIDENFRKNLKKNILEKTKKYEKNFLKKYLLFFVPIFSASFIYIFVLNFWLFDNNINKMQEFSEEKNIYSSEKILERSINSKEVEISTFSNNLPEDNQRVEFFENFSEENIFEKKCLKKWFLYYEEDFEKICKDEKNIYNICEEKEFLSGNCDFLK